MRHRQVGILQHMAGHTAQDQFAQTAMGIGPHHQQISANPFGFLQQDLADKSVIRRDFDDFRMHFMPGKILGHFLR